MSDGADLAAPGRTILMLGGSLDHLGGVEAFCERSAIALARHDGSRTERVATSTAYLRMAHLGPFLKGLGALIRHRRRPPDIAWLQYVNLPDLLYLILAKLLGMRVMVTPHLGANWRSQTSGPLRWLSERVLRLADRIALISPTQEVELLLPKRVPRSLIRNFLPVEVLSGPLVDGDALPPVLQLIHSSRLSEGKGTFLVVEVCARLRAAGVPFCARITGSSDAATMERLRTMVADLDLGDDVAVLGRVPEADLLDHLRRADVLIHLSRIDSYPLIVLEAMACGAVPVVMELAGARDMVETFGGEVVTTTRPVEEALAWITGDDLAALRSRRAETAARVRAEYEWGRCAAALAAALDACVAGQRKLVTRPAAVD